MTAVAAVTMLLLAAALTPLAVTPAAAVGDRLEPISPLRAPLLAQDDITITILHNNDGESKLLPDADSGFPGIARFVETLKMLQDEGGSSVITLTSGDNFLASKEFNASLENGTPFYDAQALGGLYDAMGLGNHDFDFGPDVTADFVSSFDPPVPFLAANIDVSNESALATLESQGLVAGSTVVDVGGTQVGIIGAITPRLGNISSPRDVEVSADVAAAVNDEVADLEAQGINKIILISHLQGLQEDKDLIPQLSGVDVVIAGGGDELLKNSGDSCLPDEDAADSYPLILVDSTGRDIPVVTGPGGYRCIGRLNVTFTGDVVSIVSGEAIGVALDGDQDADVLANVETPLEAAVSDLEANVLATSEVALDGRRPEVRTTTTNEGSLLADALLDAAVRRADDFGAPTPVIAVQNGGGIRNDAVIPAGNFTESDTFDIAPFSNFVVVTEVERTRLRELLEAAVGGLPEAEGFFPQPAGFTMTIDPSQPASSISRESDCGLTGDVGSRVVDVTLDDGTQIVADGEVVPGDPVALATIDFLANGGDCYPLGDLDYTRLGVSYQQALAEFVSGELNGSITAADYPADGTRRIVQVGDAAGTGDTVADPTPTPAPEPTATPEPEPTATPEPADDSDDDDDDDDDDAATSGAADDDDLAETGVESVPTALAAAMIFVVGVVLVRESQLLRWLYRFRQ